jgi:hypothetical protein
MAIVNLTSLNASGCCRKLDIVYLPLRSVSWALPSLQPKPAPSPSCSSARPDFQNNLRRPILAPFDSSCLRRTSVGIAHDRLSSFIGSANRTTSLHRRLWRSYDLIQSKGRDHDQEDKWYRSQQRIPAGKQMVVSDHESPLWLSCCLRDFLSIFPLQPCRHQRMKQKTDGIVRRSIGRSRDFFQPFAELVT